MSDLPSFIILLILAFSVLTIAFYRGFFSFLQRKETSVEPLSFFLIFKAITLFLALELLFAPVTALLFITWMRGIPMQETAVDAITLALVNALSVLITSLGLLIFFLCQSKTSREAIWGSHHAPQADWLFGMLAWLVSYPLLIVIEVAINAVMALFGIDVEGDQVAVKQVKQVLNHPWAFSTLAFAVCFLAPFVEELIFRGFIQQGLKRVLTMRNSILVTSVIFALIHFSKSQGFSNILLIGTLFVLSCFLGFVRERQGSLWASIGLHSTFNSVSVALIAATS